MSNSRWAVGAGLVLIVTVWLTGGFSNHARVTQQASMQAPAVKAFTVRARRYAFEPSRIEVNRDDLVRITLVAEDIAHSFTIDEYRISKRASPGTSVTFEFRADRAGRFVFYCSLTADEGCRDMRGELVVG